MKKTLFVATFLLVLMSCSKNKEVIKIAEDYSEKNICTLFDNASLVKMKGTKEIDIPVKFISDEQQKLDYLADITMSNLKAVESRGTYYLTQVGTSEYEEKAKAFLIADAVNYASIQTIKNADPKEGFYVVTLTVEFGEEFDDQVSFVVVLSKDLQILNKNVDLNAYKKHLEEAKKK